MDRESEFVPSLGNELVLFEVVVLIEIINGMAGLLDIFLLLSLGLLVLVGDTEGSSLTPLAGDFGLFFVIDVGGGLGRGVCGGGEGGHVWEGGTHYPCWVLWFCMWSASCPRARRG